MQRIFRYGVESSCVALALLGLTCSALAGFEEGGMAAYKLKDYETAARESRPLASQGDPRAHEMGVLHFQEALGGQRISEAFPDAAVAALVRAARSGDFREVDALIARGVDVNYRGTQGITPIAWVVAAGDVKAAGHLLDAKADPNVKMPKNSSAMSIAVELGTPAMLEQLLKKGGNPNLRAQDDDPLLHRAAYRQRKEQINLLLKYGADINGVNEHDKGTAASAAIVVGRFDLAVDLVERGLNANLQELGATAEIRHVPSASEQQRWKNQLIAVLKERGVTFPAVVRRTAPPPARIVEAEKRRKALQESQGEK